MDDRDRSRMGLISRIEGIKIEHRPMLPDGSRCDSPWWIASPGINPVRGRTLREAIDRMAKQRDKAIERLIILAGGPF